jgi:tetratricopeptide (TPR) repeat protein
MMFAANPLYVEYESLLRQLNQLAAEGNDESAEADAIRDRMETLHWKLSPAERERLRGLSSDLYMLQDEEVYEPLPDGVTQESLRRSMRDAWEVKDYSQLLLILRKGPKFLAPDQVAFYRFYSYEGLGHYESSLEFLRYAIQLNHENWMYKGQLLNSLMEAWSTKEAEVVDLAHEIITQDNMPPHVLISAAYALYRSTLSMSDVESEAVHRIIVDVLERTLNGVTPSSILSRTLIAEAFVILGYSYEEMTDNQNAIKAFDKALSFHTEESSALVGKGRIILLTDPVAAMKEFEKAVEYNSDEVFPYLQLASFYMTNGDFRRGIQMAEKVCELSQNPRILATVLEWIASAYYELNAPLNVIHDTLEQVLVYDPLNERVRNNLSQIYNLQSSSNADTNRPVLVHNFAIALNEPERPRLSILERAA